MTNTDKKHKSAEIIQGLVKDLYRQKLTQTKISNPRLSVIQHLMHKGPQTLKSLAAYRNVSAASMSRLVDSLVSKGWVLRANSREDKRSKIFMVTRKGTDLANNQITQEQKSLEMIINTLSEEEQAKLYQSVLLVQKVINQVIHPSHGE